MKKKLENKNNKLAEFKNSQTSKEVESAFPDAKLTNIEEEN